ncbi:MAG: hypothetical protein GEV11_30110 [Streptosporangiales bacterium]|nr:hypothetical protein [Streptosporangiales bacterium]
MKFGDAVPAADGTLAVAPKDIAVRHAAAAGRPGVWQALFDHAGPFTELADRVRGLRPTEGEGQDHGRRLPVRAGARDGRLTR